MVDWEDIRHFLAVAQSGSLSAAARSLKVDHATVSRRLAALEAALDVRLVDRLPRSCRLTTTGQQVFERALEMEAGAHGIARLAKAAHAPLVGRVTLSAAPVLVTHLLAERLTRFRTEYPDIRLSLSSEGQQISLSRREADVALRMAQPDEASSVARKIGRMPFGLYAHRAYVHLTIPERWQFIAFDESFADMPQQVWLLGIAGKRPVACELNLISEHLIAARAGAGVAGLPCFIGERDRDLVRIDQDVPAFARDIWLAVHHDLRQAPAVRAVMDFVAAAVVENRDLSLR
ncbi:MULTISPECIES: LysR family transcriptional regulator [unclassified Beijerinckia]|uniref:LysR family transcriptional regulator n=1 Tax=unclassified Beijerinckia TaxID=2638183 RepID=UPI000894F170|nr:MULTISPECIES: LysR family transcriptional regulator [unclassified Beijerinckia]MDH7794670.1 DNA-binding transcriptional LysR family regulator [Beijerinckia sp. GAS462]SEB70616.1 transcriptional regulator, LysR family [Beijerinckia sp. 28-YEA-48]